MVAGIGGSYLGAKAVIDSQSDTFGWLKPKGNFPTIVFAGNNIGEDYLSELIGYRHGGLGEKGYVVGFNKDNKLIVGSMTGQEAKDAGIRDAVSWGPSLIINGEAIDPGNAGGGINPRSAIGQREDGAVLLLVIEGRQPGSMGASYQDLIDIMLKYGAVNAGNLDGGTSSSMVYEGELITNVCSFFGERTIPTGIMVERRDQ